MTDPTSAPQPADDPAPARPEPGQRLLALRVIPTRLSLLSVLVSCVPHQLDGMAVSRAADRLAHQVHVLSGGPTAAVQDVLDLELEDWGEWLVQQLYEPRRHAYGRGVLARWLGAYRSAAEVDQVPPVTALEARLADPELGSTHDERQELESLRADRESWS